MPRPCRDSNSGVVAPEFKPSWNAVRASLLSRKKRWAIVNAMTARRSRAAREPSKSRKATAELPANRSPEPPPTPSEEDGDPLPFEDGLARLEALVGELEAGELPLEGALGAFEEGVRLSRQLDHQLGEAEQRVEVLLREAGRWVTAPLDPGAEEERDEERDGGGKNRGGGA